MNILHQKLIKFWSRDTMICESVLGKWTPTPPGVEFWMTKIRFDPQAIGKQRSNNYPDLPAHHFVV